MRRTVLPLTTALLLLVGSGARADAPAAAPAPGRARVAAHRITARFDPAAHRVVATDVMTFDTSAGRVVEILDPGTILASSVPLSVHEKGVSTATLPEGIDRLELTYANTIFDAVMKKDDLSWVVGDSTKGLVSEKGIYLTGASAWYPVDVAGPPRLARFDVTTYVPEPLLVVTQGRVPERSRLLAPKDWTSERDVVPPAAKEGEASAAFSVSSVLAQLPTDDLSLSAGPYRVATRTIQGIEVSTYFLEGEADAAPLWLAAMEEVVARYESRLGTYPHPKFDIVENFFQTGYGMPSYTLLGDEVIRYVTAGAKASGGKIPPGYLDHEYVHGWYGNGLFVDPADGNWCEALTSYFSNYLARELESPVAGAEARRGVLEKYALRVNAANDYPVRSFRTKTEDKDNDVGYGKGSMIFHVLRERLGDAEFFTRVRRLSEARVGTFVSWTDWLAALDGEWARPYLERTGLPELRIASATTWPGTGSAAQPEVRVELVVDQPRGEAPWPAIDVPLAINGRPVGVVHLAGKSAVWRGRSNGTAMWVDVDAGHQLLRRIAADDLPACLNRTIEAAKGVVRHAGADAVFGPLADRLAKDKGLAKLAADAAPPADASPVVDLRVLPAGETVTWPPGSAKPRVSISAGRVVVDGTAHEGKDLSILWSANDGPAPRTWFVATTEAAASRAKYLPYYGWDSYVVFEAGKRTPLARGRLDTGPRATHRTFVEGGLQAQAVERTIATLTSDEFEGRRPGTEGHAKAERHLGERLLAALHAGRAPERGIERHPFPLGVPDLTSSRDLAITTAGGVVVIPNAFHPVCASPARTKGAPLEFGEGDNPVPLPGRIPDTSVEGLERLWRQIDAGTSPALLLLPSPAARKALAPLVDAPNALTAESEAELAAPGRDGLARPRPVLAPWIAARRGRAFPGLRALRVPLLLITDEAYERIFALKDIRSIDFEVGFGAEKAAFDAGRGGANLWTAWVPSGVSGDRPPAIVVSAHYDSFGRDGARFLRGADDNASGVACVLSALEGLAALATDARRALVVCLFDGEEWGLAGSRAFVPMISKLYDVKAVVNVDAVGRVKDDRVHVIGASMHADLGRSAVESLAGSGLRVGADIDKFAYTEGSDHWPFHEAGIPAITFWASDYGTMNTVADDLEKVDPVGVARLSHAVRELLRRLLSAP